MSPKIVFREAYDRGGFEPQTFKAVGESANPYINAVLNRIHEDHIFILLFLIGILPLKVVIFQERLKQFI